MKRYNALQYYKYLSNVLYIMPLSKVLLISRYYGGIMVLISSSHPYRQEQGAVVRATQLGHTVQKYGGHFLVLVLDEAEHLEGEAAHLALPVLKHCCLRVLITSAGPETRDTEHSASVLVIYTHICASTSTYPKKTWNYPKKRSYRSSSLGFPEGVV